jgi:hypothetical protein
MRRHLSLHSILGESEPREPERGDTLKESRAALVGVSTKTPNFLIIGAAKSGTTAIWHYLRQHPQIYLSPRKHTRFFAYESEDPGFNGPAPTRPTMPYAIADVEAYHALFEGATDETAIGEASHSYLYRPDTAERIRRYAPDMKLIAILRDPAERAYSNYEQMVRNGRERIGDFDLALRKEQERLRDNWWPEFHYVQVGLYHAQLKRYFDLFERDQIKVYLYEDLGSDALGMVQDVFRFVGVDDAFVPETAVRYNASGLPRNRVLHLLLQELRRVRPIAQRRLPKQQYQRLLRVGSVVHNRNLAKTRLPAEKRRRVIDTYFREDILRLEGLIQRDLSAWLE